MLNNLIDDAVIFVAISATFIALMFIYSYFKLGSFAKVKEHLFETEGKGALTGIALAIVIPLIIALSISIVKAEEIRYMEDTVIFIGIDNTQKQSPQCYGGGVSDTLTSNLGINQHLVGYKSIDLLTQYTHHSCAINRDAKSYDAFGVRLEWRIK